MSISHSATIHVWNYSNSMSTFCLKATGDFCRSAGCGICMCAAKLSGPRLRIEHLPRNRKRLQVCCPASLLVVVNASLCNQITLSSNINATWLKLLFLTTQLVACIRSNALIRSLLLVYRRNCNYNKPY